MTIITKATAYANAEGWPVLEIQWDDKPGMHQVAQSHPIIWRNGLVSIDDETLGLPELTALQVPGDDTSGTLTVGSALLAPQAAALAVLVFEEEMALGETPTDLPIPTVAAARAALAKA